MIKSKNSHSNKCYTLKIFLFKYLYYQLEFNFSPENKVYKIEVL